MLDVSKKNMADQKEELAKAFDTWKGDLEQVDDVCVIGMKAGILKNSTSSGATNNPLHFTLDKINFVN